MSSSDKEFRTAIIVMPPENEWEQINQIRKNHDKAYRRWMPHINLVYPFVSEQAFNNNIWRALTDSVARINPFELRFENFDFFEHGQTSCTLFLNPITDDPNSLSKLQSSIESAFPFCNEQSKKTDSGFHGHLTVGQFRGKKIIERYKKKFEGDWKPFTFTVDRVYVISRVGMEPFKVKKVIMFDGSTEISEVPQDIEIIADNYSSSDSGGSYNTTNDYSNLFPVNNSKEDEQDIVVFGPVDPAPTLSATGTVITPAMEEVVKRLKDWISSRNGKEHLPKTKFKLMAAIKPMCCVRSAVVDADTVINSLVQEGIIKFSKDKHGTEKVEILKKDTSNETVYKGHQFVKEDPKDVALRKSKNWIMQPLNSPRTKESLMNSIKQICLQARRVEEMEAINALIQRNIISIDLYSDKVTYLI